MSKINKLNENIDKILEAEGRQMNLFTDKEAEDYLDKLHLQAEGLMRLATAKINSAYKALVKNNPINKTDIKFSKQFLHDVLTNSNNNWRFTRKKYDDGRTPSYYILTQATCEIDGRAAFGAALDKAIDQFNKGKYNTYEGEKLFTASSGNTTITFNLNTSILKKVVENCAKVKAAKAKAK